MRCPLYGGGGQPRCATESRLPGRGRYARLLRVGLISGGLAALAGAPPAALAQTCTPAGGTLPTVSYSGAVSGAVSCEGLTGGLTLTIEPGATIGSSASLDIGVKIDAVGDGDNPVKVVSSGTIRMQGRGILVERSGKGKATVEHKAGKIVAAGSSSTNPVGIRVEHRGEANEETGGIHVISAADIDLSGSSNATRVGIVAYALSNLSLAAGTTVPIRVDVTGGTIITGAPSSLGHGVHALNDAKGGIKVTVADGAKLGTEAAPVKTDGINASIRSSGNGDGGVEAVNSGEIHAGDDGIYANNGKTGDVTVSNSGKIHAGDDGISALHNGNGTGDVKVEAAKDSVIQAKDAGIVAIFSSNNKGGVTVVNSGRIEADTEGKTVDAGGIVAVHKGAGLLKVEHRAGGRIVVRGGFDFTGSYDAGIVGSYQPKAREDAAEDVRGVEIVSAGDIESTVHGIVAQAVNDNGVDKKVPVTVRVTGGAIKADHHGVFARAKRHKAGNSYNNGLDDHAGGGKITVIVGLGASVVSKRDGIHVDGALLKDGMREQTVEVHGTVTGGDKDDDGEKYAGVHMVKGGTVVIGPRAHVSAASGVAVKANAEGDMVIILVKDKYGLTGRIDGEIRNAAETAFRIRDASDMETALTAGQSVKSAVETKGVYRTVRTSALNELKEGGSKVGYTFKMTGSDERQYHARARVYEALPSVLMDLNAPAPRMSRGAAGGNSAWAAFDAGEGERQAAVSTTSKGMAGRALAWDFTRWGVASGLDFPAEEDLTVGVSAHHRRGKATVKHGGTVKASGTGVGASVTYGSADAVYVRGWFSYSKFSGIELVSRDDIPGSGNLSKSDVSGSGNAIGVEAGMRTELEGMTLTPRGGLVFSSVDINGFSDLEGVAGSGKVSGSGKSFKARLGVTADIGEVAAGAAVYASLDAEHDFSAKRDVTASGTKLTSKPKATWGRLGLGGEISLSDDGGTMLSGEAYYATAGGGNSDFGGGLTLGFRF